MLHEHPWLFDLGAVISSCFLASLFENCLLSQRKSEMASSPHHNPAPSPIFEHMPFPHCIAKRAKVIWPVEPSVFCLNHCRPLEVNHIFVCTTAGPPTKKGQPQALTAVHLLGQKVTNLSPNSSRNDQIKQSIDPCKLGHLRDTERRSVIASCRFQAGDTATSSEFLQIQ